MLCILNTEAEVQEEEFGLRLFKVMYGIQIHQAAVLLQLFNLILSYQVLRAKMRLKYPKE